VNLPTGLTLAACGALSGTPTAAGTFSFTVTARDSSGFTGSQAYTLTVAPMINLSPATLPAGTAGTAYGQTITATETGYQGAFTFAVSAGNLPPGLTLAAGGALSGTPAAAGTLSFTVTATDSSGFTGGRAYTLTISQPISLSPATLPAGTDGTAYSQTITAAEAGYQGAFTFAVSAGNLPPGLTLTADGALSGTPTAAGTFSFTVTARDSSGFTGSQAYTMTVAPVISLSPATLPAGTAGTAYSQAVTAAEAGYQGAFTFAVSAGNLPPGLTLAAGGALSGTPAAAGTFSFTVTATDSSGSTGGRAYSVTVAPAPTAVSTQAGASAGGVVGTAVLSDTATLTGGDNPTGTLTFTLTQPDGSTVPGGTVPVTGDRAYSAPTGVPATEVGTYTWHASYSGDTANAAASDDGTNESVVTAKASPTIVMQTSGTGTAAGSVLSNTATLSGGFNVNGGTITFTLTAPDGTQTTETVTVNKGDGTYSTPTGISATQQGTYTWTVTYSGNATNNPASDKEVVGVAGPPGILLQASDATYTVTVTNDGPGDAQDVMLTDDVPPGATFVSAAQTAGPSFTLSTPAADGTGTILASAASLPAGESAVFQVVLLAGPTTVSITNTATVTSTTSGPGTAPSASGSSGFAPAALPLAGAEGLQVRSASWFTKFAVPVQLALSPTTVAAGSPAGTLVGVVSVTTQLVGQFEPAVYSLPPGEADNASFALTGSGGQGFLGIEVPASEATKASYVVRVHVNIGVGDQAQTFLVTVVSGGEHVTARLVRVEVGKKKKARLMVEEFDAITGAFLREFLSPFQAPADKGIGVSVRAGAPDQIVVTARKGRRTVTSIIFA
jgi:uncharacterized repeat protein (TIGR01451 family)